MSVRRHDAIMVVVDRLSKVAHFIPVKSSYNAASVAKVYMENIVKLHGIPKKIISDRDPVFSSSLWRALQCELGTQLNFSSAYHPETNGQTERVNQILEDMLRMYVMDRQSKWEEYLHLVDLYITMVIIAPLGWHHFRHYMPDPIERLLARIIWRT